jgi:hypothetical protein
VMTAYRDAVESWLIEVEPLYLEFAPDVFREEVIGTTTFHPPDGPATSSLRGGGSWDTPDPVTVQFTLADLLDTPNPVQYQWEFTKTQHHRDAGLYETDSEVVADTYQLTQQTLDAAIRRTGEFLREIGFGVEVDEDTDTLNV